MGSGCCVITLAGMPGVEDQVKKLERKVASLERKLSTVIEHTGTASAVAEAEAQHAQERKAAGQDAAARASAATRAAHDVMMQRRR
jgi:CRISPR/Cas system CMR-associated protein Cmr5 small subunit